MTWERRREIGRVEMFYAESQENSFKRCCFGKELKVVYRAGDREQTTQGL